MEAGYGIVPPRAMTAVNFATNEIRQDLTKVKALSCTPVSRNSMPKVLHIICPHCDTINRTPRNRLAQGGKCGSCHRPLFEGRPLTLSDATRFDKHFRHSDIPLLIDFWAAWCGPCHAMAPHFEQAAAQLEPEVRLVKVDADTAPELSDRFAVRSLPTLLLAHRGREVARRIGLVSYSELIAWARRHLALAEA
jgi:thioredoxin 2